MHKDIDGGNGLRRATMKGGKDIFSRMKNTIRRAANDDREVIAESATSSLTGSFRISGYILEKCIAYFLVVVEPQSKSVRSLQRYGEMIRDKISTVSLPVDMITRLEKAEEMAYDAVLVGETRSLDLAIRIPKSS